MEELKRELLKGANDENAHGSLEKTTEHYDKFDNPVENGVSENDDTQFNDVDSNHTGRGWWLTKIVDRSFKSKTFKDQMSGGVIYDCTRCTKQFDSQTGLLNHLRMHQTVYNKFTCSICKKVFDKNNDLIKHKSVHDAEKRNFICLICESAFTEHYEYLYHTTSHTKRQHFKCEECHRNYYSKRSFLAHIECHYDKKIKCSFCPRIFKTANRARSHEYSHRLTIECGECGKLFSSITNLRAHMPVHTGVKPFQCYYCGKGYVRNLSRRGHMRIHTDERPYKCDICGRKFRKGDDCISHKKTHSSVRYKCEVCHKKFKSQQYLKTHMSTHDNTCKYPCPFCDRSFITLTCLKSHTLHIHTESKTVRCDICQISFKTKSHLTRHNDSIRHKNQVYGQKREEIGKCEED